MRYVSIQKLCITDSFDRVENIFQKFFIEVGTLVDMYCLGIVNFAKGQ